MSILPIPDGVDVDRLHVATRALFSQPQWEQRTPAWYEVRKGLITASDAAAILGIPPYPSYRGNPRNDLLKKKLDNAPVEGMFLVHGVKYEDEARDAAMQALGETCFDFGLVVHPEHSWMAASPDGITARGACVEIKCPMKRKIDVGHVPHHYYPQVQLQMEVTGMELTYFVEYLPAFMTPDGTPFVDIKVVPRDRRWFADNLEKFREFWNEYMGRRKTHVPNPEASKTKIACLVRDDLTLMDIQTFALKALHEQPDPINVAFFSEKNLRYLQKRIVLDVDKLTGVEIARQNDQAVTIVMVGMYQRMRGSTADLTIQKLNNAVLQECVKQCVTAVLAQKTYLRDATGPVRLLDRGVNPSVKGLNFT